MPELSADQRRQLDALRQVYLEELPDKASGVAQAAAAAVRRNWDATGVRELHHVVHRLAGSAAIWGFTAVSEVAGQLEEIVLAAMEGRREPTPELADQVRRLVDALHHAVPRCHL